jgi:hypothetical protein
MANHEDVSESLQVEDFAREICGHDITTLEIVIRRMQGECHAQIATELNISQREVYGALAILKRDLAMAG